MPISNTAEKIRNMKPEKIYKYLGVEDGNGKDNTWNYGRNTIEELGKYLTLNFVQKIDDSNQYHSLFPF